MNGELHRLFLADQGDRSRGLADLPPDLEDRDLERVQRVREMWLGGALQDAEDWFMAAVVLQHGDVAADYRQAHEFALEAAKRGHPAGRWMAAAAYDRWLMHQGKPQRFGTQYLVEGDRSFLWEVDPATTDDERAAWGVPLLAELIARADGGIRKR